MCLRGALGDRSAVTAKTLPKIDPCDRRDFVCRKIIAQDLAWGSTPLTLPLWIQAWGHLALAVDVRRCPRCCDLALAVEGGWRRMRSDKL